jgi:hypothetical protein
MAASRELRMSDRLDDLLRRLPAPGLDHVLDQLEPAVWRRIDARRGGDGLRLQLVAAGMALAVGLVLGWSMNNRTQAPDTQSLYASYADVGPTGRLESGL